jgi:CRISPR-associated protein Csy1
MSENEQVFETWEEVILDFFLTRVSESKLYKANKYIQEKEAEIKKEHDQIKTERLLKAKIKKENELLNLKNQKEGISEWLTKKSQTPLKEGKRTIKATHLLKFSHSSAPAEGLVAQNKHNRPFLTTGSLKKDITYDMAHSNGNLVTISRFLALELYGSTIIDLILNNDYSFLESFGRENIEQWKKGFSSLVEERQLKTGEKCRQCYFPKNNNLERNHDYDLLIPLFASSLCHEIYSFVNDLKFGEVQQQIKEAKKEKNDKALKYFPATEISLPNVAVLKFGGAQPQNVSMMNKNRSWKANKKDRTTYGVSYLFSSQPPTWQSKLKPPINRISLFDDIYNSTINTELDYLRGFLLHFKQLDLSIKDPKRKRHLIRWVDNIIDECLFYITSIQNLPAGWSAVDNIRLKPAHQYLLDPYRLDDDFQASRQNTDWQSVVCADFAQWINRQLRGKDKQFTPQAGHTRLWKKLLEKPLREHMEMIEQEIEQALKEAV